MLWSTTPSVIAAITMEYSKPISLDKINGRVSMNIKLNQKKSAIIYRLEVQLL